MYDLTKPGFGAGAEQIEASTDVATPIAPEPKPVVKQEEVEPETSVEENKVPYSRFKKFHDLAEEASKEAEFYKEEVERLKEERQSRREEVTSTEAPAEWKQLYGDNEASQKAWQYQQRLNESFLEQAETKAIEALRRERDNETSRTQENLGTLDDHLEQVAAVAGRDLTEAEESRVLDIIDDWTPKNNDGTYAGALISPDKAWQVYEFEQNKSTTAKRNSRDSVAALTSSRTDGETTLESKQNDENWTPGWDNYKRRL